VAGLGVLNEHDAGGELEFGRTLAASVREMSALEAIKLPGGSRSVVLFRPYARFSGIDERERNANKPHDRGTD